MIERIQQIQTDIDAYQFDEKQQAENFRLFYLSKKGIITELFEDFKSCSVEEKKSLGSVLNQLKKSAENKYTEQKELEESQKELNQTSEDISLPVYQFAEGSLHPLRIVEDRLLEIFYSLGFDVSEGPEIEDDYHNFGALNFAEDHPARDMQDTFFIAEHVLRTHTSSVQIREMEKGKLPLRLVMPGRVYRNEAVSARSNCFFHQIEGLYIDKGVSFADLKQTLYYFVQQFFGKGTRVRFRSSYFPFTEPSAEMDIWAGLDTEENRRLTKGTGWLEVLGCGMVHPNVLKSCNIDPEEYTGFAFGMGIDRITMLKYGITDIRDFFINDIRMLKQFAGV
ncbi:MAG: phenylalanine--tRNA ligase subunit alpha [Bacteroidota bacterium]|jgi:phenylalanyl-tRNA synthetase alpha chain|nr:phenylalanine--tRNA ligase subunit alpha [Bacteroidota bacterium]